MVQADGTDHRRQGILYDVGGVQPSADAGFQHHHLALLPGKPHKGSGADQFKLGGLTALRCHLIRFPAHLLHTGGQCLRGNHLAVNLHPLPEIEDKRRDEHSRSVPRRCEGMGNHRGGGAFAVGAHHMHIPHLPESVLLPPAPGAVDIVYCFLSCHNALPAFRHKILISSYTGAPVL